MEVAARYSRHSPLQVGVGVWRDRRECRESTGREPSCPPIAGDIRRRRWLSQARRLVVWFPGCRSPRRAIRGRSRHRPAADSMPAGSPLTQACRIAADSCPLATAFPSPVDPVHNTARSAVCMSGCAHRNILTYLVMSTETRLGQAAPLVVAMEAILAACPPVAEVEAVAEGPCEGPWLLVMPIGSLSFQASPGGLPVPVGCPVLSLSV